MHAYSLVNVIFFANTASLAGLFLNVVLLST
jgi:hypothetical protein